MLESGEFIRIRVGAGKSVNESFIFVTPVNEKKAMLRILDMDPIEIR